MACLPCAQTHSQLFSVVRKLRQPCMYMYIYYISSLHNNAKTREVVTSFIRPLTYMYTCTMYLENLHSYIL